MIEFKGTIAPATLTGINACLIEHGFNPVDGQVLDDGFEVFEDADNAMPDAAKQLVAEIFAPLPDSAREAREEAIRQELFAEYDHMVDVLNNMHRRKDITDAEYGEKLAALDAYAEALRAINDMPGWYLNPQWPPKPQV
jgi:hypothetical protein